MKYSAFEKKIPIYQINGEKSECSGCGTMIDDLFITAGHVIIDGTINPYIVAKGKKILLDSSRMVYCANEGENGGLDLAIYRIPELRSNLTLWNEIPQIGTILKSASWKLSSLGYERVECDVEVNNFKEDCYFGGNTSLNLKAGSSGSPIMFGDKVAGILCFGNNDGYNNKVNNDFQLNFCVFLSSKAILDKING